MLLPLQVNGVVDIEGLDITSVELMAHALQTVLTIKGQMTTHFNEEVPLSMNMVELMNKLGFEMMEDQATPIIFLVAFLHYFLMVKVVLKLTDQSKCHMKVMHSGHYNTLTNDSARTPIFQPRSLGVCQKRQVCRSAVLQMKKKTYIQQEARIKSLTAKDLLIASKEEAANLPFSNEGVKSFKKAVISNTNQSSGHR